jgi:hypothetical protein
VTTELDKKIKDARAELEKLEAEKQGYDSLSAEKKLAIELHKQLCHWNHTDGCGWMYHSDYDPRTWTADGTHADYLRRAELLLRTGWKPENILRVLSLATKSQYRV